MIIKHQQIAGVFLSVANVQCCRFFNTPDETFMFDALFTLNEMAAAGPGQLAAAALAVVLAVFSLGSGA